MGYRSQVAFAIRGKKEDITAVLTTYRLSDIPGSKEALAELSASETDDGYVTLSFYNESTKWYEGYPEVGALTAIFNTFEAAEQEGDYQGRFNGAFVRIGEDDEDLEITYFGEEPNDLISLNRTVALEVPHGKEHPLSAVFC